MRSQKILDKWSNLFEKNAIRTDILLTINNKSKEEILNAISETIEEIASPLQYYLKQNHQRQMILNFITLMLMMSSLIFLLINQQLNQI